MRRIISFCTALLTAVGAFFFAFTPQASASIMNVALYGDVTDDMEVGIDDVTYIQRYLVSVDTFGGLQKEAADYDHDGTVTVSDATLIQRKLANMEIGRSFGGWFRPYSSAKLTYADYASGMAMAGVPVTFTMQGGYPYSEYEPSDFYGPVTYQVAIYDTAGLGSGQREPIASYTGYDETFTYTFAEAGRYRVSFTITDRLDNVTAYSCYYTVAEPYLTDTPVIASVYTDKPRNGESLNGERFTPSCNWKNMTLFVNAVGGSGAYEYAFELITKDGSLTQDYSKDNSFDIARENFPGMEEYKATEDYEAEKVPPYQLIIKVKDSSSNETTKTVQIAAVDDFDMVG